MVGYLSHVGQVLPPYCIPGAMLLGAAGIRLVARVSDRNIEQSSGIGLPKQTNTTYNRRSTDMVQKPFGSIHP